MKKKKKKGRALRKCEMAEVLESSRRDMTQVCSAEQNGLPRVTLDTAITSSPLFFLSSYFRRATVENMLRAVMDVSLLPSLR